MPEKNASSGDSVHHFAAAEYERLLGVRRLRQRVHGQSSAHMELPASSRIGGWIRTGRIRQPDGIIEMLLLLDSVDVP